MNQERNKFLTEAVGGCWHAIKCATPGGHFKCVRCGEVMGYHNTNTSFSTWEGFGKLWTWARDQEWWADFWYFTTVFDQYGAEVAYPRDASIINPDRFANTLYAYLLKENA